MSCWDCKYAEWVYTKDGKRRNPNCVGECTFPVPTLPACFHTNWGTEPRKVSIYKGGGEGCECYERR